MDVKQQILDAYQFRHACKEFDTDKKISAEDFKFILETGRLSPSSFGFEPWRFLVLQNMALREKIRPACWGAQKQLPTASHFVIILARKGKDMVYHSDYIKNFMTNIQELSSDIIKIKSTAYQNFQENGFKLLESDRAIFDWSAKQTYIALANMMTAAAQLGIDSCPMEGFDKTKLEEILIQEKLLNKNHFGVATMAAFGYRKAAPHHPKTRQTMDNIVQWID